MADLGVEVKIFDPAVPFQSFRMNAPGVDTWHKQVLITREAIEQLEHVRPLAKQQLPLSGGMSIEVDVVKIGLQIGAIRIEETEAFIVEHGYHDILLGSDVFDRAFQIGQTGNSSKATIASAWKEDPTALSIEFFPVQPPIYFKDLEVVIRHCRILHNLYILFSNQSLNVPSDKIATAAESEETLPREQRLILTWIDTGSIWITLKSGSEAALKYLATMFTTSASAKLAQALAEAKEAEAKADISQATRDSTANRIIQEQEMLQAENISKTFEIWRQEKLSQIGFTDELIEKVSDENIKQELKKQRDQSIIELTKTHMLPLVRNVPRHTDIHKDEQGM